MNTFFKLIHPKYQKLILDYPVKMKPRNDNKPHSLLLQHVSKHRAIYESLLEEALQHQSVFHSIKKADQETNEDEPAWNNSYLPGLDIVALYTLLNHFKPKTFIEIGSGHSTKVARKSITENCLGTKIVSIDPFPRAQIDHLADQVVRQPLEDVEDLSGVIETLQENDILFIDNSHRCLPNSDVTVCFLELLPYLKKGVIVHVHDIYIPYDYPQFMCDRFYSEQYVLAAFILANPDRYKTIFPAYYISEEHALAGKISGIWNSDNTRGVEQHGGSFWMRVES